MALLYRRAARPTTLHSRNRGGFNADRTPEQEAAVNRFSNRLLAASAGLAACGWILTGCGSGQISQVSSQEAAVNGMSANAKNIVQVLVADLR